MEDSNDRTCFVRKSKFKSGGIEHSQLLTFERDFPCVKLALSLFSVHQNTHLHTHKPHNLLLARFRLPGGNSSMSVAHFIFLVFKFGW